MSQLKLCLHTQTPLVRFLDTTVAPASVESPLAAYRPGTDYEFTPGGVTRMVRGLVNRLSAEGRIREATWLSLGLGGPDRLGLAPRFRVEHVRLPATARIPYGVAKAAFWDALHRTPGAPFLNPRDIERGLAPLSLAMAQRTLALHKQAPFDLFYVHDFQLLPLAQFLPRSAPTVFRWHIPVPEPSSPLMPFLVRSLNRYDRVVVSCNAYAERLTAAGVEVPVGAHHPYIEMEGPRREAEGEGEAAGFGAAWGIAPEDPVFLLVARLDPIKCQDVAIRAMARVVDRVPNARLVIVGSGGFSGERRGGLGLPQFSAWEGALRDLAQRLGLERNVIFTGGLPERELRLAYARCAAVVLPSRLEGFGLTPVEGWRFERPALVSRGAGVSELVEEGRNGLTFDPGDWETLAEHLLILAEQPEEGRRMGRGGRGAARACGLAAGARAEGELLRRTLEEGPRTANRPIMKVRGTA